jgi:hypothetical protein
MFKQFYVHKLVCIPNRILPALLILSVEWKELHDKLVDLSESQHLASRMLDRHRDQRNQARQQKGHILFLQLKKYIEVPFRALFSSFTPNSSFIFILRNFL